MDCQLIKIQKLSGKGASIYAVKYEGSQLSSLQAFIYENKNVFLNELNDIIGRLYAIGRIGAKEDYFRLNEGNPGDGVCALYDDPDANLRLYCIRFGASLLIVGGGGPKDKRLHAFQEDLKLTDENYDLRKLSSIISQRIKDREMWFTNDYKDIEGNLKIKEDDYE